MKWRKWLKKALKVFLFFLRGPLILLKLIFEVPVFVIILIPVLVRILFVVRPFSSVYENFVRFYRGTVGKLLRLEIEGRENLPAGPFIIAARHRSIEDVGLIMSATSGREVVFLARGDLRRLQLIPYVEDYTIFINQDDSDFSSLKEACEHLGSGGVLGIFPEGSRQEELKEIRTGVLRLAKISEVPIVPLNFVTEGPYPLQKTSFKKVLFHLRDLIFFRIRTEVHIGEPVRLEKLKERFEQKTGEKVTCKDPKLANFLMNRVIDKL